MFRFFRFIVYVLLGYKILRLLFADGGKQQQKVEPTPPKQNIHNNNNNNWQQKQHAPPSDKFNDAEVIDYEEVK